MSAPNDVLLIRKQDLKSFFEENKVRDNITSVSYTHLSETSGASENGTG